MSELKKLQEILNGIDVDKDSIRTRIGNTKIHTFFLDTSGIVFRSFASIGVLTLFFKNNLSLIGYVCLIALLVNLLAVALVSYEHYRLEKQLNAEFEKFKLEVSRRGMSHEETKEMLFKSKDPQ